MNTISLFLEDSFYSTNDYIEYMNSLNGIKETIINNEEIIINYDANFISIKIIKYETFFFMSSLKTPTLKGFNKHSNMNIKKYTLVIEDLCCEYCLCGMIEELLEINGIESAHHNYDYTNKYNVEIFITYDDSLISLSKIKTIEKDLNDKK